MPKSSVQRKGKGNVEKQFKAITETIRKEVAKIAKEATEVAKNSLIYASSDENFTQKHGAELAKYIKARTSTARDKMSVTYKITAGENADDDIKAELYFAEYGAGLDAVSAGAVSLNYVEHGFHFEKGGTDHWFYPTLDKRQTIRNGKPVTVKGDATDTSIAVRYMKAARDYARQEIKQLKKKNYNIKGRTSIARPKFIEEE